VHAISDVDPDADPLSAAIWVNDLALWASRRSNGGVRPLSACVVRLAAPELTADQLISLAELADIAGIAPSTLRSYISRDQQEVPAPQGTVGGHSVWSRAVAEEWAEDRRKDPDQLEETVAVSSPELAASQPAGIIALCRHLSEMFAAVLWDTPGIRKRWALRWRNTAAVQETANVLGWYVAAELRDNRIVPLNDLASTVRHAVIDNWAEHLDLMRDSERNAGWLNILPPVAHMLDWLICHDPARAARIMWEIMELAEHRLEVPRETASRSLRFTLVNRIDSKLGKEQLKEFLDRVLDPAFAGDGTAS
jgi:predicted DNA-binding transcriptional regulator AlpA